MLMNPRTASVVVLVWLASSALAGTPVAPITYEMPNGGGTAHGGGWNFWDELYDGDGDNTVDGDLLSGGLGQLTDGVVGLDNWQTDLGNGIAYEWIGWWSGFNPTITFDFGAVIDFETIEIHVNNSANGSVGMFWHADLSFSSDGLDFGDDLLYTADNDVLSDPSARFIVIDIPRSAQYVRVALDHRPGMYWLFLSEVRFTKVAEPCFGDLNGDGLRDQSDLGTLLAAYGLDAGGDLDGDGDTDQADLGALLAVYGVPCP
jgi:Discoidin domain-containing receptor 1/2, DS-like domain